MRLLISKILVLGLGLTLTVSGCDKQSGGKPQGEAPQSSQEAPKEGLSGTVDRTHKGKDMPDVVFEDMGGKPKTLADFKGKPLLVNIWATWCGPCIAEMPTLERLAAQRAGKLQVIAISQDMKGRPVVAEWWNKQGFKTLTTYVDAKADLGFALGGGSLPTTILYDANGKEVWRMVGGAEWDAPAQLALIDAAI